MKGDLISSVILVIIIVMSSILVLNTINPFVREGNNLQSFNEAKQTLTSLDAQIQQLFFEAPGARRSIDLQIPKGKLIVSSGQDEIKIRIEDVNLFNPGYSTQEGNIRITSGGMMDAYESDIDNDGITDLVLENSGVIFAVKKLGNATNNVVVNTTNMITLSRNKALNVNISYPHSGIFINDKDSTSYGVGYTELTRAGSSLTSSAIHIYLNSTAANVSYDVTFSLGASQDFVEMKATHISGA